YPVGFAQYPVKLLFDEVGERDKQLLASVRNEGAGFVTNVFNGKEGFQYLDILSSLAVYFKKLPGMQKFQHFLFSSVDLGVAEAQEVTNGPFQEIKLLKTGKSDYKKYKRFIIPNANTSASDDETRAARIPL